MKTRIFGAVGTMVLVLGTVGTVRAAQGDDAPLPNGETLPAAQAVPAPVVAPAPAPACPPCTVPLAVSAGCCVPDNCPPTDCPLPEYPLPCFYARFGVLGLKRDTGEHVDFATLGTPDQVVLSTGDVRFPFQGGGEILLGMAIAPTYYLESSYFGLSSWNQTAAVRNSDANALVPAGEGNLMSPFGGFGDTPDADYDYNNYAAVAYHSQLENYELNLRHQLPMPSIGLRSSFLFGGRGMRIDDGLLYETDSDRGVSNSLLTQTRNRLLGLQIGGLFEFHVDPGWWINLDLKGAICQNKIDLDTTYTNVGGTSAVTPGTYRNGRDESQTSFVGDIGLSLVYEFGRAVTADVGYRAIWVTGLATGADNLPTDVNLAMLGPPTLHDDRTAVYHGPRAGLTVRF